MTTTTSDTRMVAIEVIRENRNNAYGYIATKLNQLGVPTMSGRGCWGRGAVHQLATEAGIKCGYTGVAKA